ncbi:unnamed protein product [Cuscuta epithymum]|uniref:Uncharacterized protein n=1 Tax=Cuscuta epithymum TaxID=186058 RepID=A0AAV0FYA5_9ASTE|nr:unnamed protein product [Cuscuta epithymum]
MRHRGRKEIPTTNVLAVCDFNLLFTYVLTRWEGSAHDSLIFLDTRNNPTLNFLKPPTNTLFFKGPVQNCFFETNLHESKKNLVRFLHEFCTSSKSLQMVQQLRLFKYIPF